MHLLKMEKIKKYTDPSAILSKIVRKIFEFNANRIFKGKTERKIIFPLTVNKSFKIFFDKSDFSRLSQLEDRHSSYDTRQKEKKTADEIIKNKFHFLSHTFNFGNDPIKWNYDPVSGKEWPKDFSFNIAYKGDGRVSDIKIPWEFAKMQYLFILGKVYIRTGNKKYSLEIIKQIDSFIEQNGPFKGIHWISALEIGMRVISWIMIYPFISEFIDEEFEKRYLTEIYYQTQFIEKTISGKKNANTHLIGEAFSLMLAGMFLNCKSKNRWYLKGFRILTEQIEKQVHSDGVHKEQSVNYHRFFIDFYFLFLILHKINRISYPKRLDQKIEQMTDFIALSMMPSGKFPCVGDSDDARGMFTKIDCENDYHGILGLSATLFQRKDFKYFSNCINSNYVPDEVIWLLGEEGVKGFCAVEDNLPKTKLTCFDHSGYYILRESYARESDYLFFDCGPLGMGVGGHGHADALSIILCKDGEEFLTDPGTYSYNLDYQIRDYFRSTKAHNTVCIDEQDQSKIIDRMSYSTFAESKIKIKHETEHFAFIGGIHNGYERLSDPVSTHRYIFYDNFKNWVVFDYFQAEQLHIYEHNLHLDHECILVHGPDKEGKCVINKNGKQLIVHYLNKESDDIRIIKGQEKPYTMGWLSKKYGEMEPSISLNLRMKKEGNTSIMTSFSSSEIIEIHNLSKQTNHIFFKISNRNDDNITFFYDINGYKERCNFDGIAFNGKLLFYKFDTSTSTEKKNVINAFDFTFFSDQILGKIYSANILEKLVIEENKIKIFSISSTVDKISLEINPEMEVSFNGRKIRNKT